MYHRRLTRSNIQSCSKTFAVTAILTSNIFAVCQDKGVCAENGEGAAQFH